MPEPLTTATFWIILITGIISVVAFQRPDWLEKLMFWPEAILANKEHYRLVSHGFIHADWPHLAFNMYSLYVFGIGIERFEGPGVLALIYFSSIVGGGLLSLLIHRNHDYRALGASGGVCGVIFASIFLFPGGNIYMLFVPVGVPSWLYAILFIVLSFYGMRSGRGCVGHDAHIGGAIVGLLVTTGIEPGIVTQSPRLFAAVLGLSVIILFVVAVNPLRLPWASFASRLEKPSFSKPPRIVPRRGQDKRFDIDAILDKISKSGVESLTKEEHQFLLNSSKRDNDSE